MGWLVSFLAYVCLILAVFGSLLGVAISFLWHLFLLGLLALLGTIGWNLYQTRNDQTKGDDE